MWFFCLPSSRDYRPAYQILQGWLFPLMYHSKLSCWELFFILVMTEATAEAMGKWTYRQSPDEMVSYHVRYPKIEEDWHQESQQAVSFGLWVPLRHSICSLVKGCWPPSSNAAAWRHGLIKEKEEWHPATHLPHPQRIPSYPATWFHSSLWNSVDCTELHRNPQNAFHLLLGPAALLASWSQLLGSSLRHSPTEPLTWRPSCQGPCQSSHHFLTEASRYWHPYGPSRGSLSKSWGQAAGKSRLQWVMGL